MFNFFRKNNIEGEWRTVAELKVGQMIAVPRDGLLEMHQAGVLGSAQCTGQSRDGDVDVLWDEIESIKYVGTEQVWDIEVEGTHNFIGNNIFAHNTYITGNVGIGVNPSSYPLDVQAPQAISQLLSTTGTNATYQRISNTGGLMVVGRQGSVGNEIFSTGGLAYSAAIDSSGTNALQLGVNDAVAMTILNGGYVGIGTTAPIAKLDVRGASAVDAYDITEGSEDIRVLSSNNRGNDGGIITIGGSSGPTGYIKTAAKNNSAGDLIFGNRRTYPNTTLTAGMVLNTSGFLGVGVLAPLSTLHVMTPGSSSSGDLRVGGSTSSYGVLTSYDQSASTVGSIYSSPAYADSAALFKLGVGSGNTNQLVLKGDGNVGIGITNPYGALHVNGPAGANSWTYFGGNANGISTPSASFTTGIAMAWNPSGGGGENVITYGIGAGASPRLDFNSWNGSALANVMSLRSGKVGIGTTNPGEKLHIVSTQGQDGIYIDAPTYPEILFKRADVGKAYVAIAGSAGGYGTGTFADSLILRSESGYTHFMNAGTVVATFNGSSLGIGVTNPSAKLHISGTGTDDAFVRLTSTTASTGSSGTGPNINFYENTTRRGWMGFLDYAATGGATALNLQNYNGDIRFAAGAGAFDQFRMTIKGDSGNVGIGATAPAARLSVDTSSLGTNDAFLVSSSTRTSIMVNSGGYTAVGTTTTKGCTQAGSCAGLFVAPPRGNADTYVAYFWAGPNSYAFTRFQDLAAYCDIQPANLAITCTSDLRLKTNIAPITNVTEKLRKLNAVTFNWKVDADGPKNYGFIAQEVELLFPELVKNDPTTGIKQLNMMGIIPTLASGWNALDVRISDLEFAFASSTASTTASLAELEQAVQDQGQRISVLEDLMNSSSVFALTATSTASSSPFLASIVDALANVFASMTTYFKDMIVEALTIGKSDKPTGITFYDSVTGEPYCLKVTNGVQMTLPGICVAGSIVNNSQVPISNLQSSTNDPMIQTNASSTLSTSSTTSATTDTGQGLASTTPITTDTTASTTPVVVDTTASTTPVVVDTTASTTPVTTDTGTTTPVI